jgi:hypothetical protein
MEAGADILARQTDGDALPLTMAAKRDEVTAGCASLPSVPPWLKEAEHPHTAGMRDHRHCNFCQNAEKLNTLGAFHHFPGVGGRCVSLRKTHPTAPREPAGGGS